MTADTLPLRPIGVVSDPAEALRAAVQHDYAKFERGVWLQARRAFPSFHARELAGVVEETVNETVHRALRAASRYDPDRPALPWLFSFASNVLLERRTSRYRQRTSPQTDLELDIDELFSADGSEASEHAEAVRAVLNVLPQDAAKLLTMRYFDELDYADMAQRLHISEGALRVRMHRAKEKFRDVWLAARTAS